MEKNKEYKFDIYHLRLDGLKYKTPVKTCKMVLDLVGEVNYVMN
jgi:hypothetical protein